MISEKSLEPPEKSPEEYTRNIFIESKVFDICEDITRRGYRTNYKLEFDILFMHIYENIEKYLPEPDEETEN